MEDRLGELLLKAADAMGNRIDPFSSDWLRNNNVTLKECVAMSEVVTTIIKGQNL